MNSQELENPFEPFEIDVNTSPDEVLRRFNNELKHSLSSILGAVQILSMQPDEQLRLRNLDIISLNIKKIESIKESVIIYLEKRDRPPHD